MYLHGSWYLLKARDTYKKADPVEGTGRLFPSEGAAGAGAWHR